MNKKGVTAGLFLLRKHYRIVPFIFMVAIGLIGCNGGGGGSSSGSTDSTVVSDDQIYETTWSLIDELEANATDSEKEVYREIEDYVLAYDSYTSSAAQIQAMAEGSSETIEPESYADLYRMIGIFAMLQGSRNGSLWASLKAVLESQDDPAALAQVGTVLNELERYEEAIVYLAKAKSLDNTRDTTLTSLAASYAGTGQNEAAEQELSQAVEMNPEGTIQLNILMDFYLQYEAEIKALRDELYQYFQEDIIESSKVGSQAAALAFINTKTQEATIISQQIQEGTASPEFLSVCEKIPDYMSTLFAFQDAAEEIDAQMDEEVLQIMDYFDEQEEELGKSIFIPSCESNSPRSNCVCLRQYISAVYSLLNDDIADKIYQTAKDYLTESIQNIQKMDRTLNSLVFNASANLTRKELVWVYNDLYKNIEFQCKMTAEGSASIFHAYFALKELYVDPMANSASQTCATIEDEMSKLQQLEYELEQERKRKLAEREAYLRQLKKKADFSLQACLDSVGCLGVSETSVSVTVGGPVYAQFSIDTEKVNVGVRVGMGISDPTGNAAAADLSLGGTIGEQGTTFNLKASHSYGAGMVKEDYALFNEEFTW